MGALCVRLGTNRFLGIDAGMRLRAIAGNGNRYLRIIGIVVVCAAAVTAQSRPEASVVVSVHTLAGELMPGVTVRLDEGKPGERAVTTEASGVAQFRDVATGKHTLNISASGFDELTTEVSVEPPGDNRVDATMSPAHTDSITIQGIIETPLEEANPAAATLERQQVSALPDRPRTVTDALPLVPGVVRLPNGQLRLSGSGEHRSAMLVNSASAADPATGQFGATLPIDSISTMNVLSSPFLAEYGGFTSNVVAVETRRGGEKWHFELNDPLPEFRWRSWHMVGLRSDTPRFNFDGPLIKGKLHFLEAVQYDLRATPVITLPFPNNETRREGYNSLSALDYILNGSNYLTANFHAANHRARFENLEAFNPEPVTPNTSDTVLSLDLAEHAAIRGTLLDSAITLASFRTRIWPQGDQTEVMAPDGNSGNYFAQQTRTSSRLEWREAWSLTRSFFGTHNIKIGSIVGATAEHALITDHDVNLVNQQRQLLEIITFTPGLPIARNDFESAFFLQDQWIVASRFSFNLGLRFEQQEVTDAFRLGPRAGFVWTPFHGGRTILRAGAGVFYDRVPLNVYGFALYPDEVITTYAPDGSILTGPDRYFNLTETAAPHHSPLIYRSNGVGDFAPYSVNTNLQLEQIVSRRIRLRLDYLQSLSSGLIALSPQVSPTQHAFALNGAASAQHREMEVTAAATARKEDQIFLSYVHSYTFGNINEFSNFLANYPPAIILPDYRTVLPGDTPNRVLVWGTFSFPWKFRIAPKIEYRTGFPWSSVNALQQYTGTPNQFRFPTFFALDARITKDVKVTDKYTFRFGVTATDLSNHFNPVSVHANVSDPQYNVFFGSYRRRYTADFDVLF